MTPDNSPSPPFEPRIYEEQGVQHYDDNRVYGAIDTTVLEDGTRFLAIYEWSSHHPRQGHTVEALEWLRERHAHISAIGVGEIDEEGIGDISTSYWERMREKGLVDTLILDDGTVLEPPKPSKAPKP